MNRLKFSARKKKLMERDELEMLFFLNIAQNANRNPFAYLRNCLPCQFDCDFKHSQKRDYGMAFHSYSGWPMEMCLWDLWWRCVWKIFVFIFFIRFHPNDVNENNDGRDIGKSEKEFRITMDCILCAVCINLTRRISIVLSIFSWYSMPITRPDVLARNIYSNLYFYVHYPHDIHHIQARDSYAEPMMKQREKVWERDNDEKVEMPANSCIQSNIRRYWRNREKCSEKRHFGMSNVDEQRYARESISIITVGCSLDASRLNRKKRGKIAIFPLS